MALHPHPAGDPAGTPALPEQPALRPGLFVTRHDDHRLQVGIDPPQRVVVPDLPDVRRLLGALAQGCALPLPAEQTWPVLRRLCEADLLVDARALAASTARGPAPAVRAAWAQFGSETSERLTARASARVGVSGDDEAGAHAIRLVRDSGVEITGEESLADAWLVVSDGETPRARIDPLVREGVPHLLVSGALGSVRLGPFVAPGTTACLRCLDAHRAEVDPRRSLVVEQVTSQPRQSLGDPVLQALAVAWAVRDLLRFVEGEMPSTWSTTFDVGPVAAPVGRTWTRHPHCGCSWDEMLAGRVAG